MTDPYLAADERARNARRAGLQAKKDEQPQNTARSYASKQQEWKVSPPPFSSRAGQLTLWPVELVPDAARCCGRLLVELAGRGARDP
jgi:hypothetical protein